MTTKVKKFLTKILPCVISFGILLYFCVKDGNIWTLVNILPRLKFAYLFLAIFSMFTYWILDSIILKKLLPEFDNSIFEYLRVTIYGQFYAAITPFSSGSQASQVILLKSRGISAGRSISVLSQKFFISQLCTVLISSLSIIFKSQEFKNKIPGFTFFTLMGLSIQCSGIVAILLFYLNKKRLMNFIFLFLKLAKKMNIVNNPEKLKTRIENQLNFLMENNLSVNCGSGVYVYSFLQNICLCLVPFFISKSFGNPGFLIVDFIAAQTFVNLLSSANPLPGSAGTTEGSFLLLYEKFFKQKNISPAMILSRLINYYLGILIGLFVVTKNRKK